jgi:protease-4
MPDSRSLARFAVALVGTIVAGAVGVTLFGVLPAYTPMGALEVALATAVLLAGAVVAGRIAASAFPSYDVAEVAVEGPITQSGGGGPLPGPGGQGAAAEEVTEQIRRADEDAAVEALVLTLNTPGGEVVASEDIRHAAAEFDGPTVADATSLCASGGMWIAAGCDEVHAREGSRVGSVGVIGASFGAQDLLERAGVEYRRFVAGDFKDSPSAFRELREEEREYWQGLLDDWYEQFVETVVEGRGMDAEAVRDTEARVYLGTEAEELGLVDALGPRDAMEERLADRLDVPEITVEEFEPQRSVGERLRVGARATARAVGAGAASVLVDDGHPDVRV